MQHDQLDELLKPLVRQARVLTPHRSRAAESAGTETKFGGAPYAEAGDGWPECRTCKNDLVFVAQLRDDSLNGLLVFFYCFECFPWGLDNEEEGQWVIRHYAAPSGDRLEKIVPAREQQFTVNPCAVSEKPVKSLPDWYDLHALGKAASDLCGTIDADNPWDVYEAAVSRAAALDDYATLVGGYPRWIQGDVAVPCKQCGEEMKFIAQINSEEPPNLMWGDLGVVYLFRCPTHPNVFHLELQCY